MAKNKVAIVTGANKGLGYAIVKELCSKYDGIVYLTSRDEKRGQHACGELRRLGFDLQFHQLDVTDEKSVNVFCDYLRQKDIEVEILVNNAGILFLKDAKETKLYQAEQTTFVNFFSLVNFTEKILPMIKHGGNIVNISSSSGHLSRIPSDDLKKKFLSDSLDLKSLNSLINNYVASVKQEKHMKDGWGDSPYVVSKVGVNAYTFLLHRRLTNKGISVNCVHPGYVKSDMTKGAGSIEPEEAAQLVLRIALTPPGSGLYFWHNGTVVPWIGPDPRGYIDNKL